MTLRPCLVPPQATEPTPGDQRATDDVVDWSRSIRRRDSWNDKKDIGKNNEGVKVDKNGCEPCEEHKGMPGPDGEGDHGQLCQDEGSEADSTNVEEIVLEQRKGAKYNDATLRKVLYIHDIICWST